MPVWDLSTTLSFLSFEVPPRATTEEDDSEEKEENNKSRDHIMLLPRFETRITRWSQIFRVGRSSGSRDSLLDLELKWNSRRGAKRGNIHIQDRTAFASDAWLELISLILQERKKAPSVRASSVVSSHSALSLSIVRKLSPSNEPDWGP